MTKRRSDIAKLISDARNRWRQSQPYQEAKKKCKIVELTGWFRCANCANSVEVIRIDHIEPIGKQPFNYDGFGTWLNKLFCAVTNLQGLCNSCHRIKTKEERKNARIPRKTH